MASPSVPKTDELAKDIPKVVHEAVAAEVHKILDSIFHTVRKPFENPNKAKYDKVNFLVAERREATLNEYLTEAFDHAARPAKSIQVTDGTGREDDPDGPSTKSIFWTSSVAEGAAPDRVGSSTKDLPPRSPDPTDASWKGKPIKVALIIFESKDKLDAYVADKIDEELPKLLSIPHLRAPGVDAKDKSTPFIKMIDGKDKILRYLGMAEKNSEELISWEDMLNYAATCRFYDSVHMAQNTKPLRPDSALAQKKDGEMSMFDYFVRVYIPEQAKASSQTTGRDADTTQDQLVMDAKKLAYANETFVRDFEEAVEANRDRVLKQFLRKHMPRFVNKEELTYVFKGLKHAHRKGEWTCQPAGFGLRGFKHFKPGYESRSFSEDCLRNWIDWKHAGALQKMESLAKSARHYKAFKGIPELRSQQEKEVLRAISQTFLLGEEETEEKGRLHKEASEALAKLKRLDDASKKFKAATAKLAGSHTSKETETLEMEIEEALKELLKELPEPKENEPRVTEEAKRKQAKKEKKRKVKAAMKAQQDQQDQHAQKPQANQHP